MQDDQALRKFLASAIRNGTRYIVLDNIKGKLNSPTLESLVTSPTFTERLIGSGHIVKVSTEDLTVAATLNGLSISNDLCRCVMVIAMIANSGTADSEALRHPDFLTWLTENVALVRGRLINVVQAWIDAGAPLDMTQPTTSFIGFSRALGELGRFLGLDPGIIVNNRSNLKLLAADGSEHVEY